MYGKDGVDEIGVRVLVCWGAGVLGSRGTQRVELAFQVLFCVLHNICSS